MFNACNDILGFAVRSYCEALNNGSMNTAPVATGPITDAGKDIVRTNAVTHGLTAKLLVLPGESEAEWQELVEETFATHGPATDHERTLTQELAEAGWRLRRVYRIEAAFLAKVTADLIASDPTLDHNCALAAVFMTEPYTKQWRLFLRYQAATERTFNRIHSELRLLQKARIEAAIFRASMAARPSSEPSAGFVSYSNHTDPKPKPRMPRFLTRRQRKEAARAARENQK
jgi:hypothetical protein